MLAFGRLIPLISTCLRIISRIILVPVTFLRDSTVARKGHPNGALGSGGIGLRALWTSALFSTPSLWSASMQKLCRRAQAIRMLLEFDSEDWSAVLNTLNLFVNSPNAISIRILIWLRKKLKASYVGSFRFPAVNELSQESSQSENSTTGIVRTQSLLSSAIRNVIVYSLSSAISNVIGLNLFLGGNSRHIT